MANCGKQDVQLFLKISNCMSNQMWKWPIDCRKNHVQQFREIKITVAYGIDSPEQIKHETSDKPPKLQSATAAPKFPKLA